jgi:hypothetical protein
LVARIEAVIMAMKVSARIQALKVQFDTISDAQKQSAWLQLYWPVRQLEQKQQRIWIKDFCDTNRVNLGAICRAEAMTWDELREISKDLLCTIGAHSVNHYAVAQLNEADATYELVESRRRIGEELGKVPKYFAYPYGDASSASPRDFKLAADAGYEAAVTTRKDDSGHRDHLTALARLSFRRIRNRASGCCPVCFALWNGFRQLNVFRPVHLA